MTEGDIDSYWVSGRHWNLINDGAWIFHHELLRTAGT